MTTMRAITQRRYGGSEVLALENLPVPEPGPGQVRVRVHAAALNPADWHRMTGTPKLMRLAEGFRRPGRPVAGSDLSGTIDAVGSEASGWDVGDEVVAASPGAFADYTVVDLDRLVAKPVSMSFVEAAGLPIAGVTALEAVVERGATMSGERVLVNGASGGVGTYAVQLAVAMGAHVTGVCSTRNLDLISELGAKEVIDYTRTDLASLDETFDLLVDNIGNISTDAIKQLLPVGGRWAVVGGPKEGQLFGPLWWVIRSRLAFIRSGRKAINFIADETSERLQQLADLADNGDLRTVIDRTYPLEEAAAAMTHVESGRARGKVVLEIT